MGMLGILFVDDEVQVLDGLRDTLRRQRKVWDMSFAPSGPEALARLEQGGIDVVVTDMRMPGMDGAELLAQVKRRWPGVVRVVLSGHSEREAVVRALAVAHQFLSKPCSADELRDVIDRATRLQDALAAPALKDLLGSLDGLPTLPDQYWQLVDAVHDPSLGLKGIAAVVERDPAMCAKVLQLVNSAYFGMPQRVNTAAQAVSYLGPEVMAGLALGAHVFAGFEEYPSLVELVENVRMRALRSVALIRLFLDDPIQVEQACTAALVQDVGQLVLAQAQPQAYFRLALEQASGAKRMYELEQQAFGVDHADLGGYLLGIWGLPVFIVEAVTYHHQPHRIGERFEPVIAAVHIANHLADPAAKVGSEWGPEGADAAGCGDCGLCGRPGCRHDSRVSWEWIRATGQEEQVKAWVRRGLAHASGGAS